jgi:hypothetical protein
MRREHVGLLASLGTLSDLITTKIGLGYPELVEMNPWANPIAEGVSSVGLPVLIFKLADKLKVDPTASILCALMPASIPFVAALNNIVLIAQAHAKLYPFDECPLLYPE